MEKETIVTYAVRAGAASALKALLARAPKLASEKTAAGEYPLQVAAQLGRAEAVDVLLAAGANPAPAEGKTPPLQAACMKGHVGVIDRLLAAKAPIRLRGASFSFLDDCIDRGFVDGAERLLAAGARSDFESDYAREEMFDQAVKGNLAMVWWLAKHKVDAGYVRNGASAMMLAAREGDAALARDLLAAGAKLDVRMFSGATPLMLAAEAGNEDFARVLLEAESTRTQPWPTALRRCIWRPKPMPPGSSSTGAPGSMQPRPKISRRWIWRC
jgi:ankyrin repeat protein